ncbi:MAG TPA: ABC transporter substrate-binding protein [Candidatus Binatia bacterium]|nr:ABC transporter substrate-binding protein [Candidatus Binatia bacterium]
MRYSFEHLSRREFLKEVSVAGAAALLGAQRDSLAAEAPPETTRIRIPQIPSTCRSSEWVAEELLRTEGFTDVQYIRVSGTLGVEKTLASGEADIGGHFAAPVILRLEAGDPIVMLGGEHIGCFELLGSERIRTIRDLKGRAVAIPALDPSPYAFLASMVSYVGLNPHKDINWVKHQPGEAMQLLADGKIDAYLGFPTEPQEFRAKKIGRVVVNSAVDRPWSQYFCCMLTGNREFVRKNPVATKRAIRAILKSAEICAVAPEKVAKAIVAKGLSKNYDYAFEAIKSLPYGKWREYDAEDTVRFWALRLHEAGMIKSSPQKIISQGTDWRFWKELKKELKG